jgi:beta-lactamase regulating signal transducer with metallopeptidase domain
MNLLLALSLRGLMVFLLVFVFDEFFAPRMSARGRRWWWIAVPLAFLVSIPLPVLPPLPGIPTTQAGSLEILSPQLDLLTQTVTGRLDFVENNLGFGLWLAGAAVYLLLVLVQTRTALRRWARERLCTDPALLNLLEDCKQEAEITAPIGLVVSDHVSAPAILGWLRPRILLPGGLISSMSRPELRAVLFHELAHFRSLDIPLNWLFTLVRVIHWFNPAAHLAFLAWSRFREEAADETAMTWMKESSGTAYGEALLHALRQTNGSTPPFGALAIGESIHNLKRRITMINHYPNKSSRFLRAGTILVLLVLGFIARPVHADNPGDPKAAAVAAMQDWLKEIDQNEYAQSWQDASASFQKAVTSDGWTAALNRVRTPLGKCTDRKLASSLHQTEVPSPTGPQKGDFVVAQFNSSFENLAYAVETVCFEKAADGTWKASGYYIKPKS